MQKTAFLSTTIPYVNARPHLGHALEYVEADAYVRHMKSQGTDVFFLTGSDENSLKNVLAAEREGLSTQELVDSNVQHFLTLLADLDIDYRQFIRTSIDADHLDGARLVWERMEASGDIYSREYEGLYCVGCEAFYSPAELKDGKCPDHLTEPDMIRERNYFFRLSKYGPQLLEALESGALKVTPQTRFNEVTSFVRGGLEDISISRSTQRARGWGIEVPGDADQVMYVWIDALTNYTNALGWSRNADEYRTYWENASQRIHLVGKGVTRFHAVYWPAMLMSAGLPLPTDVVVHGYITASGQKISKSLGNSVDPADLVARYGVAAVRYLLLADFSPFGDGDFSEDRLVARYNTDLANGLGNLISRSTSMIIRYREGLVPALSCDLGVAEESLAEQVAASIAGSAAAMAGYDHKLALSRIWDLVRRANAYVDERAPWKVAKAADAGDTSAAAVLDMTLLHLIAVGEQLGALLQPFLPEHAALILQAVSAPATRNPNASWLDGVAGRQVTKPPPLFPKLDPVEP